MNCTHMWPYKEPHLQRRCELPEDHEGFHKFTMSWDEEEIEHAKWLEEHGEEA